jgi:hypothetical protein
VQNTDGRFKNARQTFINTATAMGVPQRAAEKLADKLLEIPPERKTKVTVDGGQALTTAASIKRALDLLHDRTVNITVRRSGDGVDYLHGGSGTGADGTTVPKTGKHYADRHLYLLADGEEVISNRHGQADRNRGLLKSINAGRLASGGTAGGFDMGSTYSKSSASNAADSLDKVAHAADKAKVAFEWVSGGLRGELIERQKLLEHEKDRDKQRLDMLKQERQALADSIKARFSETPFGQSNGSVATSGGTLVRNEETGKWERQELPFDELPIADQVALFQQHQDAQQSPTEILKQELSDARDMRNILAKLQRMGLSGPALAQVATTASLEEMRALLASGRSGISQYEHLLGAVGNVSSQLGQSIGNANYGADIKQQTKHLADVSAELKDVKRELAKLTNSQEGVRIHRRSQHELADEIAAAEVKGPGGHPAKRAGSKK